MQYNYFGAIVSDLYYFRAKIVMRM